MAITQTKAKSSQEFVAVKEIRDGVIILEDNQMRMALMASSLNFALKSTDEQEAIITQYQDFLNSLDFSIQFFIESRHLNIEPYLDNLRETEKKQTNELLKIQGREYIEFVKNFVSLTQIVSRTFYVIIPFTPPVFGGTTGIFAKFFGKKKEKNKNGFEENNFEEYKSQLIQRSDAVIQGLARAGVRAVALNTEELIELFYNLYKPGELAKGGVIAPQSEK